MANQRGIRTPDKPIRAIMIAADSNMSPKKTLGKPKASACQDWATVPQLSTALTSHASDAVGSSARCSASTANTKAATSDNNAAINIFVKMRWLL